MSKHPRIDLKSPVGRLVAGDIATPSDKGYQGQPREKSQYFFALAIPKQDPAANQLVQQIIAHTWQSYTHAPAVLQRIQQAPGGNPLNAQQFAWKIDDGDDPKFADRPGYPGCWILKFATIIPFRCANQDNQQIDPATVDLGNYGDVAFTVGINGNTDHTAGIYLSPVCFRLIGYGEKITPGPSIGQLMGDAPALPPGVSATPVAPGGQPAPAPQHYQAPAYGQPAPTSQGNPMLPPQQQAPAQPAYGTAQHFQVPPQQGNPMLPQGYGQVPVSGQGAPAGAPPAQPAPGAAQPGYPATAYPSNQQPAQPAPGTVQPAPGTVQPAPGTVQPAPGTVQPAPGTVQPAPGTVQPYPQFVYGGQQ